MPTITEDPAAHRVVVRPSGELDLATVGELEGALSDACGTGLDVVVDLSDVEFVDARTLGVLVAASRRLASGGCPLSIVGLRPRVRRVFQLTGSDHLLQLRPGAP
jgi:anti-sigma B factor antagonist